jgi:hypothetical protein
VPDGYAIDDWQRDRALRELLRSRLAGLEPVTAASLAAPLRLPLREVQAALLALQRDGYVLPGRFNAEAAAEQWCERHLLARIHRDTLGQLRREIEPVAPRDYARFLFRWQHLDGEGRIADATRLLSTELEQALADLVAAGRIHCDSYAGLRALLVPASKRPSALSRRRRRVSLSGIQDAGRWALLRGGADAGDPAVRGEALEHLARTLLCRYGVVCWWLLEREAAWLPPWRELLRVYHRLEARGEIGGGRFIIGLSGEQFALPEAIGLRRQLRRQPHDGTWLCVAAADPANLLGSVLPGSRVPRVAGARVLYRDGMPVATWVADRFESLQALSAADAAAARQWLRESTAPTTREAIAAMLAGLR